MFGRREDSPPPPPAPPKRKIADVYTPSEDELRKFGSFLVDPEELPGISLEADDTTAPPLPATKPLKKRRPTPPAPPAAEDSEVVEGELVDVPRRLASLARKIQTARKNVVANVLAVGEYLSEAQALLADHSGGTFNAWMREKCGFSPRTGYRYLEVWRAFGGCDGVTQRADSEALRKLATAPQQVIEQAKERIAAGEHLDVKTANELIAEATPEKPKRALPAPIHIEVNGAVVVIRPTADGQDVGTILRDALAALEKQRKAA